MVHYGQGSGKSEKEGGKLAYEETYLNVGGTFLRGYPLKTGTIYTLTLLVIGSQMMLGWVTEGGSVELEHLGLPTLVSATSLASGKVQLGDSYTGYSVDVTRTFDNFSVWVPDLDVVANIGRQVEIATDGVFRQHPTAESWGRLVPGGSLPYAPPAGLEGRTMRMIAIPSHGDLEALPDSGSPSISIQPFYRPAYLFAREAT